MTKMSDRDMLFLAYGCLRANASTDGEKAVTEMVEQHLYPPVVEVTAHKCTCDDPQYEKGGLAVCENCKGAIL